MRRPLVVPALCVFVRRFDVALRLITIVYLTFHLEAGLCQERRTPTLKVKVVAFETPDQPIGVPGLKVLWAKGSVSAPPTGEDGITELGLPRGWRANETRMILQLDGNHPRNREWFISGPADRTVVIPNCDVEFECTVLVTVQRLSRVIVLQEKAQSEPKAGTRKSTP
jgi:hypothetical protein